jgi:hypothetical protein
MTEKLTIETFKTKSFDGYPIKLVIATGQDNATIWVLGLIKAKLKAVLPPIRAFAIFNNAPVLTYFEIRKEI